MRTYYFDNLPGDQRLPHDYSPSRPVDPSKLQSLGVSVWSIPVDGHEPRLDAIAKERNYSNQDFIEVSKAAMGDEYEQTLEGIFQEHMHEDEEIHYVLSGSAFFDVRETPTDAWIRLAVEPGDLLVLPTGVYHRFTVDERDYITAKKLYKDDPKWDPYNRGPETDANPFRVEYLNSIEVGA